MFGYPGKVAFASSTALSSLFSSWFFEKGNVGAVIIAGFRKSHTHMCAKTPRLIHTHNAIANARRMVHLKDGCAYMHVGGRHVLNDLAEPLQRALSPPGHALFFFFFFFFFHHNYFLVTSVAMSIQPYRNF